MLKRLIPILLALTLMISCGVTDIPATPTAIPTVISTASPVSSTEPTHLLTISRYPAPADYSSYFKKLTSIPKYDPNSEDTWQIDLRSRDLTKIDMTNSLTDLMYADFDSKTQWPTKDKIPVGFDYEQIMELGKDPGLGVRALQEQGITGNGIGIAIIDQPLLVDHEEYRDHLRLYEEINIEPGSEAAMHGAAVTSIAAGKTVGVAPEANIYYIGAWTGDWGPGSGDFTWNFTYYAQAVRRVLEINRSLPVENRIRVIAMQVGWDPSQAGYDEITAAVEEAKSEGIFVVSSSLSETYGYHFHGMGRDPLTDSNQFESYVPGSWWSKFFYDGRSLNQTLLIPMDSRTTASPTGVTDYVFYRQGGWSWSIPYIAGMYALAAQVKPDITPEEFWTTALATGKTIQLTHEGKNYSFGIILDPQALITALQK